MKILVYPIRSILKKDEFLLDDSTKFLKDIEQEANVEFEIIESLDNVKGKILILVQTGGSEAYFKDHIYGKVEEPYYLLTYGSNNSLAASLEIISFVRNEGKTGEVIHGEISYVSKRIKEIFGLNKKDVIRPNRLGVLGHPSDWLISSDVDYKKAKDVLNVDLIDVSMEELIETIRNTKKREKVEFCRDFDKTELIKAMQIYDALKKIIAKYSFDGLTIRCFDILGEFKSSACLALALLNEENIIGTCEGDIPSMLTNKVVMDVLGTSTHSFQANPQYINAEEGIVYFAHCTLPFDMCEDFVFDTHFESGIGVGIHGELKTGDITVLKLSNDLTKFFCAEGTLVENEYRKDRCRTQVKLHLNCDVTYFLNMSLGNHHLILFGRQKDKLVSYLTKLNMKEVY